MVKSFIKQAIIDALRSNPDIRRYIQDMVTTYMTVDLKSTIDHRMDRFEEDHRLAYLVPQQQELKGQVEEDLKNMREYFASEEFLDSVIDRIKRKQL